MKTPLTLFTMLALVLALGSSPTLSAAGKGKGKGKSKAKTKGKAHAPPTEGKGKSKFKPLPPGQAKKLSQTKRNGPAPKGVPVHMRFHDHDRATFQTHFEKYKRHPYGLPPGLAKNLRRGKPLPPGWQKKVTNGWIVDDAHWAYFHPVPPAYLPPSLNQPRDTGIYLVGDRLVRVHKPRREVIDLIRIATIALDR